MRLAIRFSIFFLIISQILFLTSIKANQYRSRASGNWASSTTWSISTDGGATWSDAANTPGTSASDTVLIRDAGTVTINTSTTIKKLTVGEGSSGVLQFDGTVRTFIVTDDITIATNGTLQGPNSGSLTSILRIGGNLTNNGIFNMVTGSDRLVDVTFNKNGNQTISGSGTTTFNRIVLDMGTSKANTLDIQSVITMAQASGSPTLTLTNGTFKLSSASTIRPFGGTNTTIGSTAGYYLNHASAISNWGNQASLIVNGDLIIANGTMTISVSGSANRLQIGSTGNVTISNGSLTLNGRLLATTSGGVFNITNGTFEIAAGGGVNSASNSIFEVANNTFTMSGGTVSIASNNANTTLPDVNINQTGNPIIGGTFKITCGSSAEIITISSNVSFYDFQVQDGSAAVTALLRNNPLQVANNLTITSGTLDAATNNIDINVKGNWSNSGTYSTGSNNVTFNGTSAQGITKSGGETFYNLVVNKSSGTLTINNGVTVNNDLTLTNGILADGGNAITVKGDISNSATHSGAGKIFLNGGASIHVLAGTGTYGNLELNDVNGASLTASPAISGTLTLATGTLTIGAANTLNISNGGAIVQTSGAIASGSDGGTISFLGSGSITGTVAFNNIMIAGGVNFGTGSTIGNGGTLTINAGGYVNTNAPIYSTTSTLKYNTGGSYSRGAEWSATSGQGYPANVIITNNTTLDLGNGGTGTARQIAGDLQIDAGSTLSLNISSMTAPLRILGNILNNGTLTLSSLNGGDIEIGGNWTRGASATFNPNSRAVTFNGSGSQNVSVTGGGTESFDYLVINKTSGNFFPNSSPATNITINGSSGDVLQILNNIGIDLNGRTLILTNDGGNVKVSGGARSISGISNSTISFTGQKTISSTSGGSLSFGSDVLITLDDGVDFGSGISTINGLLQINNSGYVGLNPPTYTGGSTLKYNTTGTYGRGAEWNATSGAGYPNDVLVTNNTTLDLGNGGTSTPRQMAGDLQIDAGSALSMAITPMTATLTVLGNILNDGTLTLSSSAGGDLALSGNLTTDGTFNSNGRAILFQGGNTQSVSKSSGTINIDYVRLNKSAGSIILGNDVTCTAPNGGNSIEFNGTTDVLDLNGKTLTLAGNFGGTNSSGGFNGSTSSNMVLNGIGSMGTLRFISGGQTLNNLTLNRTSSGSVSLGSDVTIAGNLTLSSGNLITGSNTVTLGASASLSEASGATVLGNITTSRNISGTSGTEYFGNIGSDVVLHGTALGNTTILRKTGTASSGGGNNSILRYFVITPTTNTGLNADLVFHYDDSELNGQNANTLKLYKSIDDGSSWTNRGGVADAGNRLITITSLDGFSRWTASDTSNPLGGTPVPTTTGIDPLDKIVGESGFTIMVNGTNFVQDSSIVRFNSNNRSTTYMNETQLTASILAGDLLTAGSYNVTVYNNGGGGESNAQTFTVNKASTSTAVNSGTNPSVYGESVTFTSTVTVNSPGSGTPTGTVTFKDGATTLDTKPLDGSGQATYTTSGLSVSSHSITAEYNGDWNYNTSTSSILTQNVNKASTTTALNSSVNPSVYGESVTFTSTVTVNSPGSGTPTGTVTFKDGAITLDTKPLDGSGQATYTTSGLSVGSHSITAEYNGDWNYNTSTSSILTQNVNKASTTTALNSSVNPSVYGESVTFTSTVTVNSPGSGTPTGTVTFKDGAITLDTKPLDGSGQATYTTSGLSVGSHSITAEYNGDGNYNTSTSSILTQNVNKASTTTSLNASVNPSVYGENVTFTSTVTVNSPGSGTPTGTVTFKDGATVIGTDVLNGSGQAILIISNLSSGSHNITAEYGGDGNYGQSTSNTVVQVVNLKSTVSILTSSNNPSVYLESITFKDSVFGSVPDGGNVQFKDGVLNLGSPVPLDGNGVATYTVTDLSAGTHNITAEYSGTSNFNASVSNIVGQVVQLDLTVSYLVSSKNPSDLFESVTFKDSVVGSIPDGGTVQFKDGATNLGSPVPIDGNGIAIYTISSLNAGTHLITAVYSGTGNFESSVSNTVNQVVNQRPTTGILTSSSNPSAYFETITFKDSVVGSVPDGGAVQFKDGGTDLGSPVPLDGNGVATLIISSLSTGTHDITAQYSGTINYQPNVSNIVNQVINKRTTTSILTSSLNPSSYLESITLKDSIIGSVPDGGTVQFKDGGFDLGTPVSINGQGVATLTISTLSAGAHSITAEYSGTANYQPSTSNTVNQVVEKRATTSILTSSLNPSTYFETITFKDSVIGSVPDGGTVQFKDNGFDLGSPITINENGVATLTVSTLSAGSHNITAEYSGTSNFESSVSNTVNQIVDKHSTVSYLTSSLNPSYYGETITFKDSVVGSVPDGGYVQFKDGGVDLGSPVPINSNGVAILTVSTLSMGNHNISADYSGTSNYEPSTSNTVNQFVDKKATTSILISSLNPSMVGQLIIFRDSVYGSVPDGGTVQFKDGDANLGSPISIDGNGVATLEISTLTGGTHLITANYSGTDNYAASISNTINQVVNKIATTSLLTSSLNPSTLGQTIIFKDSVYGSVPDGGTVQFKDGDANLGSPIPIDGNGVATLEMSTLTVGIHPIVGYYTGTNNYEGSISNIVYQTVGDTVVDTMRYRSFAADSIALDRDNKGRVGKYVKRKPVTVEFCCTIPNNSGNSSIRLHLHLNPAIIIGQPSYPYSISPVPDQINFFNRTQTMEITWTDGIDNGDSIHICGWGERGNVQFIKYAWYPYPGGQHANVIFTMNQPRLPMPNRLNVIYETLLQGGYNETNGFITGENRKTPLDSTRQYAWLQTTNYIDIVRTLYNSKTSTRHTMPPKGFDTYIDGRVMRRQLRSLPPTTYNNVLLANMIALRVAITSSAMRKTPIGFGELILDDPDDPTNPYNGKMLKEIAHIGDSLMMGHYIGTGRIFADQSIFNKLDSTIQKINTAFEGPIDTTCFGDSLKIKGTYRLADRPFLKKDPSIIPAEIVLWNNLVDEIPLTYQLEQNYPNPFNPMTTLEFSIPVTSMVTLKIYNMLGQEVAVLLRDELLDEGIHSIEFYPEDLSSGVYLYRIIAQKVLDYEEESKEETFSFVKKMILLK